MRRGGRFLSLLGLIFAAILGAAILAHAVITSASNKVILAGNGATTAFVFPFVGVAAADLTVIYTDASGNQTTLVQGTGPTQYQVSLNSPAQGSLWGIGGTITYNPSGIPIASGTTLTIARTLPYTQGVSLQNQASYGQFAKSAEQALDLIEMQIQQIVEAGNRTLSIPTVDPPTINTTLPAAAQRANQALCFDGLGNPIACSTLPQGTVSSAMSGVVNAASLAAGRTAFGLGSMGQENINGGICGGASIQDDGSAAGPNGVGYARVVTPPTQDAVGQTVTCAFHWTRRVATANITYTLPRANTLFAGFGFWVDAVGGTATFLPNAADIIQAQTLTSGASVFVTLGTRAFIWTDAASSGNWYIEWDGLGAKPVTGGSFANLIINNTGGNTATITADEVVMPNTAFGGGASRRNNISISCNLNSSGLNGLDTGSAATSTFYSIWAVDNGTTLGCLLSLSASSPTMPAGYTFRKRLGWVLSASAGVLLVPTIQRGRVAQYSTPVVIVAGTPSFWTAEAVAAFVPATAARIRIILEAQLTGATQSAAVAPNGSYGSLPNQSPYPPCGGLTNNTASTVINQICDLVLESSNVYVGAVGTTAHVSTLGWEDNL